MLHPLERFFCHQRRNSRFGFLSGQKTPGKAENDWDQDLHGVTEILETGGIFSILEFFTA
jgi:hypothetical protein